MQSLVRQPYRKRLLFAFLLIAILAYLFWTGSRYPALDEKAMMSGAIQLEDPLGFEAWFQLTPDMGVFERIFFSTLNWINTNKKGMSFGILFAAAFLTATPYLQRKSFRGGFSNSVLGLVIGTPLGVCVNCAAPIARGMYAGGMRAETTLSAMIASPTLNIAVLTMLFSILPVYMAVTKIAFSLFLILAVVPFICRFLPREQVDPQAVVTAPQSCDLPEQNGQQAQESVVSAAIVVTRSYVANLWYIIKLTVPLMLLAGILGAMVATLFPAQLLIGLPFNIGLLLVVALIGVFLPAPIAFDVVVTGALFASGLDPGYAMALLFTLGSFSVYSFFIVTQAISLRAAWMLAASVVILGVVAGVGAQSYHSWQSDRALRMLLGLEQVLFRPAHAAGSPGYEAVGAGADQITIQPIPYAPPSPAAALPFTRLEAREIGIDKPLEFSFTDMWPPFWEGRSLSSGDFDRDGDLDLVIASTRKGLYLYENDGLGQFRRIMLDLGPLADMPVFNAVFVDVDNNAWPDLFVATYRQGNYLLINHDGQFDKVPAQPVPNRPDAVLTLSLAFDDINADGALDAALGNWTAGWYRRIPGEESRNRVLFGQADGLTGKAFMDLPGIPGETLSILFSDINLDGAADLVVGNDFEIPDYYYIGDGAGGLDMVTHQDALIPHTTTTTMAIKTADLFNDGVPEIYHAQIAGRSSGVSDTLKMQPLDLYCGDIQNPDDRQSCEKNMQIKRWYKSGNNFDPTYASRCQELSEPYKSECKAMLVKDLAIQRRDASICDLITKTQPIARAYCELHFLPSRQISAAEADAGIAQILRSNVLLEKSGGVYTDTAEQRGLHVGGWSWDTKIADFDNDGFQDVYIVNGTWVPNEVSPSNLFFRNTGDGGFVEASGPYGLEDYLMTAAATAFDMDSDGDLDIVTHTVNGPLVAFRNNTQDASSISFTFEDEVGNSQGIGARVQITYTNGQIQSREVQLGGGFMSFDAPRVHFGMGETCCIQRLDIHWRTGDATRIEGNIPAGALYKIHRASGPPD